MANNVTTEDTDLSTVPTGTIIETIDTGSLVQRQVVNAAPNQKNTAAATAFGVSSVAGLNATSVKGSAGILWGMKLFNDANVTRWIVFYNKASAPTVGTDAVFFQYGLAPGPTNLDFLAGLNFSTGIAFALTSNQSPSTIDPGVFIGDICGVLEYI